MHYDKPYIGKYVNVTTSGGTAPETNCNLTLCANYATCTKQVNNAKSQRCYKKKSTFQKVTGGTR